MRGNSCILTDFLPLLFALFFFAMETLSGFIVEAVVTFRPLRGPAAGAASAGTEVDVDAAFACSSIRVECP